MGTSACSLAATAARNNADAGRARFAVKGADGAASRSTPDARVDDYIKPYEKNWFWQLALKDWRRYSDIMLVALVANVLALSGMVFSMQVYDRVVPSQSATLWVLFGGVMIAIVFEFIMRMLRVHF